MIPAVSVHQCLPHRVGIGVRLPEDRGATSVEYALIASLIAVVIVTAVALLGGNLLGLYDDAASSLP